MATTLRKLRIRRVALVDKAANQEAFVELFKRDTSPREESKMPDKETVAKADLDAALERVEKAEAAALVATEALATAEAKATAAAAEIQKRDEAAEIAKYDGQAKDLPFLGAKGGVWLRSISKALGEEYKPFMTALVSAAKVNSESALLKELGVTGGESTDPNAVAETFAKKILVDHPEFTQEQALTQAYKNPIVRKAFEGGTN